MNEKPFFEVFRTLQVDGQLHSLFEQVMVTRVSTNPGRDVLRVYIVSKKLIAKDQLFHICSFKETYICVYNVLSMAFFIKVSMIA